VANRQDQPANRVAGWAESIRLHEHEDKVLLILTLIIGALVGLVVVAFIVLTENLGARLYPAGGAAWRRLLIPLVGSLATGFLLFRYFPNARAAAFRRRRSRCSSAMDLSVSGRWPASSVSVRYRWQAALPWAAKVRRYKLGRAWRRCLAAKWV